MAGSGNSSSWEATRSRRDCPTGWLETLAFAVAAAVVVQVARLAAQGPEEEATWLVRNASLFVLPFLAGYFAHRRQLDARRWVLMASPFVVAAFVVNLYPYAADSAAQIVGMDTTTEIFGMDSATEALVALHLPVVLWFAVAYPYMGGTIARMSGAWTSSASRVNGSSTTC